MKIFIESIDKGIWDAIENGPFIPNNKKNMMNVLRNLGLNELNQIARKQSLTELQRI